MDAILDALSPLLQALAIAAVGYLAKLIAQKWHLDLAEADERRLKELAQQGVLWAEEQARKAFVDNGGVAHGGTAKRQLAVDHVERGAALGGIRKARRMTRTDIEALVEAELHRVRQPGQSSMRFDATRVAD